MHNNSFDSTPPYFESLHRPFQQPLKATRWVCEFIASKKETILSSNLNIEFYLFLLNKLNKVYNANDIIDFNGVSSRHAIENISNYIDKFNKKKKKEIISKALANENRDEIQRQIYSSYKAASYYVNLAKEKFKLITSKNTLSNAGQELLSIKTRKHITDLTYKERLFYFNCIVENDFLLFISLCLFKRLEQQYKVENINIPYFDFIQKAYGIRHFSYTNKSLSNYTKVREAWIGQLDLLTSNNIIRSSFLQIIKSDDIGNAWLELLTTKFKVYSNENFKNARSYEGLKEIFIESYKTNLKDKKDVQGFVNLYDIKQNMKISHNNFNTFLNSFYEAEKAIRHIFFSNIVSSIDRRQRFTVRGLPVFKIKFRSDKK